MVLERYPVDIPLEVVKAHPDILSAVRLRARRNNEPTRYVLVVHQWSLPPLQDLGSWGSYTLRHCQGDPVRCYKCYKATTTSM